jgi:CDP-diacylglycerol pyrophosphatase
MKPSVQAALLALASAASLAAPAAERDALKQIVQQQCLPHWRAQHDPAPCERVSVPDAPDAQGYAVLADRKGGAHFLLIPTQTITGIEDPSLLRADAPNYFAAAWQARDRLDAVMGHELRHDAVGLAINSARARGQDQLHIHIECLRPPLYRALQMAAARMSGHWSTLQVEDSSYRARRIHAADLSGTNPIALVASGLPEARAAMGDYTIIVAGVRFKDGPGFIVLTGRTPSRDELGINLLGAPGKGLVSPGETLLDSSCAVDPK